MSTRDAEETEAAPLQPPPLLEKDECMLAPDGQQELQKSEVESASAELQSGNQTQEGCLGEERSRMDIKGKKKYNPQVLTQRHRAGWSL